MTEQPMRRLSWIITYYRNAPMLELHALNWGRFPDRVIEHLAIILIDDGSPEHDRPDPILRELPRQVRERVTLLRMLEDIPWNQHGARNLGAKVATTDWLLVTDIDRIVIAHDMQILMTRKLNAAKHYKPLQTMMHPLVPASELGDRAPFNQFVCTRKAYWQAGGYDEDYCGSYGGDAPFLKALTEVTGLERLRDVRMYRYNRHLCPGASTTDLDRDLGQTEYSKRFHEKHRAGDTRAKNPIRFKWERIEL